MALENIYSQWKYLPLPSDPKYCGHASPKKDTPKTENTNIIIRRSATILAMSGRDKIIVWTITYIVKKENTYNASAIYLANPKE